MSTNLIASTPISSMSPLAFKGIMAYASFPQIRDMLLHNFGDEFVLLFAKPVENSRDGMIDWYTPVQGDAKKITELPEEQKKAVLANLQKMGTEIRNFADELIDTQDPLKLTRGNILKLALMFPSESDLYVVGEQPVFTCWGFGPGSPGVEPMNLSRLSSSPVKKAPAAVPVQEAPSRPAEAAPPVPPAPAPFGCAYVLGSGCLWWCLALLPLLALLLLLFTSFGPLAPLSGVSLLHVPLPEAMLPDPERKVKLDNLETQISDLKGRLDKHVALCVPPKSPEPEKSAPEGLIIPEDATDASFMQGRWLCRTGLSNSRTNEAVQMTFSFGDDGLGDAVIIERDDQCKGGAKASMQDHKLHIDISELMCARHGGVYNSMSIDCENAEGSSTKCYGLNKNGSRWEAVFIKLR